MATLTTKLIEGATLKVNPGAPHGLTATHKDQLNGDLLDFPGARGRMAA
jgi:non-heme chloroperoxidase